MIDTDLIRSAVSVLDAARFYGYEPNRAGFICCPFHSEKTPSMKLYRRRYKCFGCGESGDVIDFVSRILSLPFRDAVARLNTDFRLGIDLSAPVDTDQLRAHRAAQAEKKRVQAETERAYIAEMDRLAEIIRTEPSVSKYDDALWQFVFDEWSEFRRGKSVCAEWREVVRMGDEYRRLRLIRDTEKPTSWDDMSSDFLEALGRLDYLEWWLDENLRWDNR
jgi:hypothetical protein